MARSSSSRSKPKSCRCRTVSMLICTIAFLLLVNRINQLRARERRYTAPWSEFSAGCGREIGEGLLCRVYRKDTDSALRIARSSSFHLFLACDFAKDVCCRLHGRDVVHGQLRDLPVG